MHEMKADDGLIHVFPAAALPHTRKSSVLGNRSNSAEGISYIQIKEPVSGKGRHTLLYYIAVVIEKEDSFMYSI